MLELFIALFGGTYYAGKIGSDRKKTKQAKQRIEENTEKFYSNKEEWLSVVTDRQLEDELNRFILDDSNYDAVWAEVSEAFSEMPWNTGRTSIAISPGKYGAGSKEPRQEALRIMMARRGKLTWMDASYGIENYSKTIKNREDMKKHHTNMTKFVLWINEQLRNHGIDEDVVIQTAPDCAFTIDSCEYRSGKYIWMPLVTNYIQIRTDPM